MGDDAAPVAVPTPVATAAACLPADATPGARLVCAALLEATEPLTRERLVDRTGLSTSAVGAACRALVAADVVSTEALTTPGRGPTPDQYRVRRSVLVGGDR